MEAIVIKGIESWGALGAVIFLVGGFVWYVRGRDFVMERLVNRCFDVIDANTKQSAQLEGAINSLTKEVDELIKHQVNV